MDVFLAILGVLAILIGLAGTVVPILPGAPLMLGGMILIGWVDHFERVGWGTLTVLIILTVLSLVVDFVATALGAKRVGASSLAIVGAAIGTIVGLFFGLVGVFFAPFVGAVLGELINQRDLLKAGHVGLGTWIGLLLGTAAKLAIACSMIGFFAFFYFF
jgi:uncharacterized protein YqgC (DUF456 family)